MDLDQVLKIENKKHFSSDLSGVALRCSCILGMMPDGLDLACFKEFMDSSCPFN